MASRRRKSSNADSGPSKLEQKLYSSLFPPSIAAAAAASSFSSSPSSPLEPPAKRQRKSKRTSANFRNEEEDLGTTQLEDDQLFMLDTGNAGREEEGTAEQDQDQESDREEQEEDQEEDQDSDQEDQESDSDEQTEADSDSEIDYETESAGSSSTPEPITKPSRSKAAWTDPSLKSLIIPLSGPKTAHRLMDGTLSYAGTSKLKKLREEVGENEVRGDEYEKRLRKMFQQLHPPPPWASIRLSHSSSSLDALLKSNTGLLSKPLTSTEILSGSKSRARIYNPDKLEIRRLRDVNANERTGSSKSSIECINFHPSNRTQVLMTASKDRRIRLFQIDDGSKSSLLHTLHVPDLPTSNCSFHPSGTSALISGMRPYFYTYDVSTGQGYKSSPWRGNKNADEVEIESEKDLSLAKFQPNMNGSGSGSSSSLLAVGGKGGNIHLLDWGRSGNSISSKASITSLGSRLSSLRQNSPVRGLAWDKDVNSSGNRLVSLGLDGTFHVWDKRNLQTSFQCLNIRKDVGQFEPKGIESRPMFSSSGMESDDPTRWAVGSEGGFVNLYGDLMRGLSGISEDGSQISKNLDPKKAVGNLTTSISNMKFSNDGQLLVTASKTKRDSLKVVHVPSSRVFANWPTAGTPLGHVSALDFSRGDEYLAIGNTGGRVLLYKLQ